jgi:hypothetical protein
VEFDAQVAIKGDLIKVTLDVTASNKAGREIEKVANFAAKGDYGKSMKEIERALEKYPTVSELHRMLAHYYVSWAIAMPDMVGQLQLPFDKEYATAQLMFK